MTLDSQPHRNGADHLGVVTDLTDLDDISHEPDDPGPGETEQLLRRIADLVNAARPMPLSASAMINRDEVLDLIEEAATRLPEELRAARWLLREREEYLERMRRDGEEIVEAARARAERMVQRTEVVKAAEAKSRQILDTAEADARRMRHEAEDFCDQRLGSFEIVLEKTLRMVSSGRRKLQGNAAAVAEEAAVTNDDNNTGPGFFDQDVT